jgi:integrase
VSIRRRTWQSGGETKSAWICDYLDRDNVRRQRTFATRRAADAWLVRARHEVTTGTHTPDSVSVTIAEAAALWLERCERDGLERSTLTQYRSHIRHHIGPLLGSVKLSRLTRPAVERFTDEMQAAGRSKMLAKAVLISLRALIGEAQRRGLTAQNVATEVTLKLAKRHEQKVAVPSKVEIKKLIDETAGRERPLLITAVFTGMRASELRGLTWNHVDFANRSRTARGGTSR